MSAPALLRQILPLICGGHKKLSIHNWAPARVLYGLESDVSQIEGNTPSYEVQGLGAPEDGNESSHIGGRVGDAAE